MYKCEKCKDAGYVLRSYVKQKYIDFFDSDEDKEAETKIFMKFCDCIRGKQLQRDLAMTGYKLEGKKK